MVLKNTGYATTPLKWLLAESGPKAVAYAVFYSTCIYLDDSFVNKVKREEQ